MKRVTRALATALFSASIVSADVMPAPADETWAMLEGRWRGVGTIALDGGGTERLKCQAVYKNEADGHVAQRLTCVGASYRIEGIADLISRAGACRARGANAPIRWAAAWPGVPKVAG